LPLYEYECPKHGTFEKIQKFSDPPLTKCPTCGGPVERLLSAPAIQFKGTGWYITDYARKSTGGEAAGNKDVGKKDGAGDKGGSGASEASKGTSSASSSSSSDGKTGASSSGSDKKSSGSDKKK